MTNSNWDYNNYYSSSNKLAYLNGTTYSTLPSWGVAINGEANGKNLNPYFANDSSFRVYQRGLNGAGIPIPGVLFDIEGEIRNDQAPDIGCDEFMVDFGITQLLSPSQHCAHNPTDSVKVLLRQFGDVPFTDIKLAYQVNNGPIYTDTILGTIYNDIEYTFHTPVSLQDTGNYTFKIWLLYNNDDNVGNDTLVTQRYSIPSPVLSFGSTSGDCAGSAILFYPYASVVPPYTIVGYQWIFGDGDTSYVQNASHVYATGGIYPVTLRVFTNVGCYAEVTQDVQVMGSPQASFTSNDPFCLAGTVDFVNHTIGNGITEVLYFWDFGDNSTSILANPSHYYGQAGEYPVTLYAFGSNGCNDTITNTVHIYPPAPANAGTDTIICPGGTAALLAHGGIDYSWNTIPVSKTAGISVSPAMTTTYTVSVTDAHGCSGLDSVKVIVGACVNGTVQYDNLWSTPVNNTTVFLKQGNQVITQANTNNLGQFLLKGIFPGTYTLVGATTKPHGGINSTDALLINKHFTGIITLEGVRQAAGDVNATAFINATDALWIAKRFTQQVTYFPSGDWISNQPILNVAGLDNLSQNIKALCYGDVNGSYIPSYKMAPSVFLSRGKQKLNQLPQAGILPVVSARDIDVSALSLVFEVQDGLEIKAVRLAERLDPQQQQEVIYHKVGNQLRIAWYGIEPLQLKAGETFLLLETNEPFPDTRSWALTEESELADQDALRVGEIELDIPVYQEVKWNELQAMAFPNPAITETNIEYFLPLQGKVSIEIMNPLGMKLKDIIPGTQDVGRHELQLDVSGYTSSVIFCRISLEAEKISLTKTVPVVIQR